MTLQSSTSELNKQLHCRVTSHRAINHWPQPPTNLWLIHNLAYLPNLSETFWNIVQSMSKVAIFPQHLTLQITEHSSTVESYSKTSSHCSIPMKINHHQTPPTRPKSELGRDPQVEVPPFGSASNYGKETKPSKTYTRWINIYTFCLLTGHKRHCNIMKCNVNHENTMKFWRENPWNVFSFLWLDSWHPQKWSPVSLAESGLSAPGR